MRAVEGRGSGSCTCQGREDWETNDSSTVRFRRKWIGSQDKARQTKSANEVATRPCIQVFVKSNSSFDLPGWRNSQSSAAAVANQESYRVITMTPLIAGGWTSKLDQDLTRSFEADFDEADIEMV